MASFYGIVIFVGLANDGAGNVGKERVVNAWHKQPDGACGHVAQTLCDKIRPIIKNPYGLENLVLRFSADSELLSFTVKHSGYCCHREACRFGYVR